MHTDCDGVTRLKFLFTTTFYPPYHIGGDALHVKWLADELAREGHDVHVMFSLDAYELKRGGSRDREAEAGPVHVYPLRSRHGRLETLSTYVLGRSSYFSGQFDRLIADIAPDVVHHHNISLLGYDLLRKRGSYLNVYTAHDYWLVCQRNDLLRGSDRCQRQGRCWPCVARSRRPPQLWRHGQGFRDALSDIDVAIAPSGYVGGVLSEATALPWVTLANFVPEPPEDVPPSGLSDFFLYVGVLERHKGIVELVELFRQAWREIGARLVVAGTGRLEDSLRRYVNGNRLGDAVNLLGWCDHDTLYSLYEDAHALVMPSLWPENAPLAALEALSMGTPVVASDAGGLPEIVGLQGEGFVCQRGQLKETLTRVRNAAPDRQRLRDIYRAHFSPERFTSSYLDILEERRGARAG